MILRKPYTFLIKNFKRIHLLLTVIMSYIFYKSNNILAFYNGYINKSSSVYMGNLSTNYINVYFYLLIFLVIIFTLAIYILMKQKKKPTFLYLSVIIYYLILLIAFFQISNNLAMLEIATPSPQLIRIVRDITFIITIIQALLTIFIAIRAVGFDIKKFNFSADLEQLEIEVTDDEEFELTVGADPSTISRKIRKQRRELKYFVIENLFVISLISIIILIVIIVSFVLNYEVYNKTYHQQESFRVNNLIMTVTDSYLTNVNFKGKTILKDDKQYVVINLEIENKDSVKGSLDLTTLALVTKNNLYQPITGKYQSFFDLGIGYFNQKLNADIKQQFILLFKIDGQELKDNLFLRFTESVSFNKDQPQAKYKKIQLRPILLNEIELIGNYKLKEKINFEDTVLKNSLFKIENSEIGDKFYYEALICYNQICSNGVNLLTPSYTSSEAKTLLKLGAMYMQDKETNLKINNGGELVSLFGTLRFNINNKTYEAPLINKTPSDYIGEDIFLEVPSQAKMADNFDLILNIRNKQYIYKLK